MHWLQNLSDQLLEKESDRPMYLHIFKRDSLAPWGNIYICMQTLTMMLTAAVKIFHKILAFQKILA